ncbi:helix-turn-helix domain-containing protein [Robbsia andropogonis]|uniref:helix-turn-helix domain-containing protein n=2 Tax=Robbsia andropogonis TaxID=28092 RepID=UPI00069838EE
MMVTKEKTYCITVDRNHLLIEEYGASEKSERGSLPTTRVASLLAFVESAQCFDVSHVNRAAGSEIPATLSFRIADLPSVYGFNRWLCECVINDDPRIEPLRNFLRVQEAYQLVLFLLRAYDGHTSVARLAQRYGLSAVQFRRICRSIFGCGLKQRLRQWRALNALHDILSRHETLTELAYQHGFSSSSHFSQEIKFHFGARPGCLR